MKTRIIITLIGGFMALNGFAQQDATFTQYFFNPLYVNPAYAGSRDVLSGTLVHRSQWLGIEGAPTTQALSLHSAIPNTNLGLGLQAYHDIAGPMNNTGLQAIFAYHLPLNEELKLSFGLGGTLNNLRIGFDQINTETPGDLAFNDNARSVWVPDANFGLYLYNRTFYTGLSATHLIETRWGFQDNDEADDARFYRHYYLTAGYVQQLTDNIGLRPSVMLRYSKAAPLMADLNAALIFWKQFYAGLGYRFDKRVAMRGLDNIFIAMLEYNFLNRLRVGYSFDIYANRNSNAIYNRYGTHEIMFGWDLGFVKTKMADVRFF
ncbi:MAG TPA: type IX secretion system membrane protein PorP/SprF [Flavobacteriales bacterium]|nr:type IX secretion system membrane protein PorP/SprF [Flavobacteriales bacterium]